jgi:hypothetical protein
MTTIAATTSVPNSASQAATGLRDCWADGEHDGVGGCGGPDMGAREERAEVQRGKDRDPGVEVREGDVPGCADRREHARRHGGYTDVNMQRPAGEPRAGGDISGLVATPTGCRRDQP